MSLVATQAAWAARINSTAKLVYLCLAFHADDNGFCWPSVQRLMTMCNLARSAVLRALHALEDAGLVEVTRTTGKASQYRLKLEDAKPRLKLVNQPSTGTGLFETPVPHEDHARPRRGPHQSLKETTPVPQEDPNLKRTSSEASKNLPRKRVTALPLPEDFKLTPELERYTEERLPGVDAERLFEHFIGWAKSNGKKYADWQATYQNWVRNSEPGSGKDFAGKYPKLPSVKEIAWR